MAPSERSGDEGEDAVVGGRSVGLEPGVLAPHAISRWARESPDVVAIDYVDDGSSYTYAQLDDAVRRWAAALSAAGTGERTHVATMLPNGEAAHLAFVSLGWLRAIEVPLNPALTGRLLHYTLDNSDAAVLLTTAALLERVRALDAPLPSLHTIVVVDDDAPPADARFRVVGRRELLARAEPRGDLRGPSYRDITALMYTSGTTGPSKGVVVPWAVVYQFWSGFPEDVLRRGEAVYCPLPMAHNSGRSCLNFAMAAGARFVCRERFSVGAFLEDVRRHDCVTATLVGPMTQVLFAQPQQRDDRDNPLRSIICGPLVPEMDVFKERFGVEVATCYGMTETGIVLTTGWEHGPWQNCGRPRPDYPCPEVRVVNEHDEPLGPGEVGELVVRSAEPWSMNAGYYNMPDKTADAWRNGWFHTGDAFRYDEDGWFYLVDRMKDAIRRRGENISSFEVENIVLEHPQVTDCAAIAVPATHGEDEVMIVVEAARPAALDPAALVAWLEPRMPRFMVPRFVEVVGALPRNETTLRVKKFELRARGVTAATWDREHA